MTTVTAGDLLLRIFTEDAELRQGLADAEKQTKSFGKRMGGVIKGALTGVVVGAAAGAAAAVGTIGVAAFNVSRDTETAAADIAASLGIPIEKAEEFADVARRIYGNNFADSVGEAGDAVAELAKQMGLTAEDPALRDMAENAFRLRDAFGVDVNESISSVKTLMDNFGISGQEAFDLIATGFQTGLDRSGDFTDTIGEYSNVFANAGLDAGQFFSALSSGAEGGVLGTDKIADAFKELGITLNEGGDDAKEALSELGLDFDNIVGSIKAGDAAWGDYIPNIIDGLNDIEDPIKRNQLQVDLFGTMAEDLGEDFTRGLDLASAQLKGMEGNIDSLDAQYETFGQATQAVWRRLVTAVSPFTDKLLELVNDAMPHVMNAFDWFEQTAIPAMEAFAGTVRRVVDFVKSVFRGLGETIDQEGTGRFAYLKEWVDTNLPLLQTLVGNIVNAMTEFWRNHGETIMTMLSTTFQTISIIIETVLKQILFAVQLTLQLLTGDWEGAGQTMKASVQNVWNGIADIFRVQMDMIRSIFGDFDWAQIGRDLMDGIIDGVRSGAGRLGDAAREAAGDALDAWKRRLGISSPSKVAAKEIGAPFAQGIGLGIEDEMRQMQRMFGMGINGMVQSFASATPAVSSPVTISVNVSGGGGYEAGRATGRGIMDELRARGLR